MGTDHYALSDTEAGAVRFARLPDDRLACCWCGVELDPGAEEVLAATVQRPGLAPAPAWREPYGLCADCQPWWGYSRALASRDDLRAAGPAGAERLAERIASICCLLDVDPPSTGADPLAMSDWIAAARDTGTPSWAAACTSRGITQTACTARWGFITDEDRVRYRAVLADVLAERIARSAPPVPLEPPEIRVSGHEVAKPGGCLICGVDTVAVPASEVRRAGGRLPAARQVWARLAVDGPHGQRLAGHVCPACEAAIAANNHAVGATAVDASLAAHLGLNPDPVIAGDIRLRAMPWWATHGEPASTTRWAHIGDAGQLDGIRDRLARAGLRRLDDGQHEDDGDHRGPRYIRTDPEEEI